MNPPPLVLSLSVSLIDWITFTDADFAKKVSSLLTYVLKSLFLQFYGN